MVMWVRIVILLPMILTSSLIAWSSPGSAVVSVVQTATSVKSNTPTHSSTVDYAEVESYPLKGKAAINKDKSSGTYSAVLARRIPYELSRVYFVLSDYKNFPAYMPHTVKSDVIKESGVNASIKWVDYTLKFLLMIKVRYTLKITHELTANEAKIAWQMTAGKQFNDIAGYWQLVRLPPVASSSELAHSSIQGGHWTGLKYVSMIDPKLSIPRPIFNTLTKNSVYEIFDAVLARLRYLYPAENQP